MVKRYFVIFLLLIAIIGAYAQVREVVHLNGNYYSQATLMVDTIYNVTYEKDTVAVIVPRGEGIVYPSNEAMGQFVTWMQGHPVYATPIVQYDSVAHRRNISGDTLRIIFSNKADALPQYSPKNVVWQHRQVTITDSAQLLSAEQYRTIAQGGDTSQFIIEPTIIYTDTLYIRNIVDTVYGKPHVAVDLGLSVKWATCNVGAEKPEEYGDYFAWGEVEPKDEYSWENYKWGIIANITKYNAIDGKIILDAEDDVATVHWGGNWRMPTVEEQTELREQCVWIWITQNGVKGYKVVGPNGNFIFLPAAGNITGDKLSYPDVMGYLWSSSVKPGINAHRMHFAKNIIEDYEGGSRACGASVRPVCP